jgi:hypothetical protein
MVTTMPKVAFGILVICLGIGGLLLLSTGWWLPEVNGATRSLGFCWLLVCIATGFIWRKPYWQLAAAWLWFLVSGWWWWTTTAEKSLEWFLYQDMFPVAVLVCSHFVVLFRKPHAGKQSGQSRF